MNVVSYKSFREGAKLSGVRPRVYETRTDAHAAVDVLTDVEDCGDRVLVLVQSGRISSAIAETLLRRLFDCFASPLENVEELAAICQELRRFEA